MDHRVRGARQLGALIRTARLRQNMTQQALANLSGVEQKTISAVENGSEGTKLVTMFNLIAKLGLDLQVVPRVAGSRSTIDDVF